MVLLIVPATVSLADLSTSLFAGDAGWGGIWIWRLTQVQCVYRVLRMIGRMRMVARLNAGELLLDQLRHSGFCP